MVSDDVKSIIRLQKKCMSAGKPVFRKEQGGKGYCGLVNSILAGDIQETAPKGGCGEMFPWKRAYVGEDGICPECFYGREIKGDYHTHTAFSDGRGTPKQNIEAAIKEEIDSKELPADASEARKKIREIARGFDEIAITDHALSYKTPLVAGVNISKKEETGERIISLHQYIEELQGLKEKYDGRIRVLAGVEIEATLQKNPWLDYVDTKSLGQLDFMLFEHPELSSFERMARIAGEAGIPAGLAHPHMKKIFAGVSPQDAAMLIAGAGLFMELHPLVVIPDEYLVALRDAGVKFSTGSDAHGPGSVGSSVGANIEKARQYTLEMMRF